MRKKDRTGERYGRLTIKRRSGRRSPSGREYWECLCDCGRLHYITGNNLRPNVVKSCGCDRKGDPNNDISVPGSRGWARAKLTNSTLRATKKGHSPPNCTIETIQDLWYMSGGRCKICTNRFYGKAGKWACLDHCHDTGIVRGFLCDNCNKSIGQLRDFRVAVRAATYLTHTAPTKSVECKPNNGLVVYTAGPITKGDRVVHFEFAAHVHSELMFAGFSVINPMTTMLLPWAWELSHSSWLDSCKPLVLASDALLRLPGDSLGASRECAWASEAGIPVFFSHFDIINYFSDRHYEYSASPS